MDNLRFIDTDTWEIIDEPKSIIHVDKDIAETIAILNKKGYKTRASCSGHSNLSFNQYCDKKENLKKYHYVMGEKYIKEIDKVLFLALIKYEETYIMFDQIYDFDKLPKGFRYETSKMINNIMYNGKGKRVAKSIGEKVEDYECCTIRKCINLVSKDGRAYNFDVITNKLKKANKELLEWARELKDNN